MDQDGTDDAYEDEDYEAKPESEATDAEMSFTSALTLSQHVVLLCIAFAAAFML